MGATSVTGVGQGMSNGEYKPENNCGCGCGDPDDPPAKPKPIGCITRHVSGGKNVLRVGSSSTTKVCS